MGDKLLVGIVVSEWNQEVTNTLLEGCRQTLLDHGVVQENLQVVHVPGSYELPIAARFLLKANQMDAVICLGCIIKGETEHDVHIANAVSNGLMQLSLTSGVPCIFGVLTTNDEQQAKDRAGGKHGNKGIESAQTALRMAQIKKDIHKPKSNIGFKA